MQNKRKIIEDYFSNLKDALDKIDKNSLIQLTNTIYEAGKNKSSIYLMGNGGSASLASHMACDLSKGASYGFSQRYIATALNDNVSTMLAYSNDIGFENVFLEQLKNCLKQNDVVIAISGSGNSPNLLKAIDYANQIGARTAAIIGFPDGKIIDQVECCVRLNICNMQIAEDLHVAVNHVLVNLLIDNLKNESLPVSVTNLRNSCLTEYTYNQGEIK